MSSSRIRDLSTPHLTRRHFVASAGALSSVHPSPIAIAAHLEEGNYATAAQAAPINNIAPIP
jgi:hypothetical protein